VKRLIIVLAATASLIACSPAQSGSLGPAPTVSPPASTASAPPAPASSASADASPTGVITIQAWFTRGAKLFCTLRTQPRTLATSRLALTDLVAGPTTAEAGAGVATAIAADATFTIPGISGGVATVDLPATFYAGDQARMRRAQVVYTLTQFPTVSRVDFRTSGATTGAPGSRADYADLLPPIVVTSLAIGERVSNPVTVAGTADVFEATVSIAILDARRVEVATTFTNATCGTGCRGAYSASVGYAIDTEQAGTVEVYEVSAKDGSRINVVDIPVRLSSGR
jgi:hypothetical protein